MITDWNDWILLSSITILIVVLDYCYSPKRYQEYEDADKSKSDSNPPSATDVDSKPEVLTPMESSLGTGSHRRRRVLKARARRRNRRNPWPWKTTRRGEERLDKIWKQKLDSDIEEETPYPYEDPNQPIIPYDLHLIITCRRIRFWVDYISYTTDFTYNSNFNKSGVYVHIPPQDIRLLDIKLGVPNVSPPGCNWSSRWIWHCQLGLGCVQYGYCGRLWRHEKHNTRRLEAVRKAAKEYHTLKQEGCLEKAHALGKEPCCENPVGRSWARARARCEMIYQVEPDAENFESVKTRKRKDMREACTQSDLGGGTISSDAPGIYRTKDNNLVVSYEAITAPQLATHFYECSKKNDRTQMLFSGDFDDIFGFSYDQLQDKDEDSRDMVLFNCEWFL
ncbi:hypothetical protein VKT23_007616 [Stygiomarasmius scandens]|uniref:Uncharacterized protein n=1 Tax=Marasmiellus scandens TaxID=2682957 RepID=A0ABR1JKC9_9AGAR